MGRRRRTRTIPGPSSSTLLMTPGEMTARAIVRSGVSSLKGLGKTRSGAPKPPSVPKPRGVRWRRLVNVIPSKSARSSNRFSAASAGRKRRYTDERASSTVTTPPRGTEPHPSAPNRATPKTSAKSVRWRRVCSFNRRRQSVNEKPCAAIAGVTTPASTRTPVPSTLNVQGRPPMRTYFTSILASKPCTTIRSFCPKRSFGVPSVFRYTGVAHAGSTGAGRWAAARLGVQSSCPASSTCKFAGQFMASSDRRLCCSTSNCHICKGGLTSRSCDVISAYERRTESGSRQASLTRRPEGISKRLTSSSASQRSMLWLARTSPESSTSWMMCRGSAPDNVTSSFCLSFVSSTYVSSGCRNKCPTTVPPLTMSYCSLDRSNSARLISLQ